MVMKQDLNLRWNVQGMAEKLGWKVSEVLDAMAGSGPHTNEQLVSMAKGHPIPERRYQALLELARRHITV